MLPVVLTIVATRTREPQRIASERHPFARLMLAVARGPRDRRAGAVASACTSARRRARRGRPRRARHRDRHRPSAGDLSGARVPRVAENGLYLAALAVPGALPAFIELGLVFDLVVVVSGRGRVQRQDPRGARHRRHVPAWASCVTEGLVIAVPAVPVACGLLIQVARTPRTADRINVAGAHRHRRRRPRRGDHRVWPTSPRRRTGSWYRHRRRDRASSSPSCRVVGLLSALVSPTYLAGSRSELLRRHGARAPGTTSAFTCSGPCCWRSPLVNNLGVAWLLVEATHRASALLVAYSGRRGGAGGRLEVSRPDHLRSDDRARRDPRAVRRPGPAAAASLHTLDWHEIAIHAHSMPADSALLALLAHPRRAGREDRLGAGAQLAPRRTQRGSAAGQRPAVGRTAADGHPRRMAGPGHARAGVAPRRGQRHVPRVRPRLAGDRGPVSVAAAGLEAAAGLLKPRAHGRARAGHRLRTLRWPPRASCCTSPGHALAKALGFYAAMPLLRHQPAAAEHPPRGLARASSGTATAIGVSLGSLSGLPPSPLFFSEVLILLGGVASGQLVVTAVATALLGLGFLGLAHALIEGLLGGEHQRSMATRAYGPRGRAADRHHGRRPARPLCLRLPAPRFDGDPYVDGGRLMSTQPTPAAGARGPAEVERAEPGNWRVGVHAGARRAPEFRRPVCRAGRGWIGRAAGPVQLIAWRAHRRLPDRRRCRRHSRRTRSPQPPGTSARPTTSTAFTSPGTSRCDRCSTTARPLDPWTVRVDRAAAPTRSPSGRSTRASSNPGTFAFTSSASASCISTFACSTSAAASRPRPPAAPSATRSPTSSGRARRAQSPIRSPTPRRARPRWAWIPTVSCDALAPCCSSSSASTTTSTTSRRSAPASGSPPGTMAYADAQGTRAATQRAPDRAPLPVRHDRPSAPATSRSTAADIAHARDELRAIHEEHSTAVAPAAVRRLAAGPPRRRRRPHPRRRSAPRRRRARRARLRHTPRRARGQPAPVVRRIRARVDPVPPPETSPAGRPSACSSSTSHCRCSTTLLARPITPGQHQPGH